ncbi:MAG TPA: DUF4381 domain-containing protein [Gammaproteobacteria bacterium]|nr:DUF4381 domain-containing protein [Gammaproteobacteria bacterium]
MKPSLDDLRPLHAPEPLPWWPPAPGWWILLGLALLALAIWAWRRRRLRLQRLALRELTLLAEREAGFAHCAGEVNRLLKRYALVCFPRDEVAGLSGRQWLEFLRDHGDEHIFFRAGKLFEDAPYQRESVAGDIDLLFEFAENWIRSNRPGARR